jgi:hypothetical protein
MLSKQLVFLDIDLEHKYEEYHSKNFIKFMKFLVYLLFVFLVIDSSWLILAEINGPVPSDLYMIFIGDAIIFTSYCLLYIIFHFIKKTRGSLLTSLPPMILFIVYHEMMMCAQYKKLPTESY